MVNGSNDVPEGQLRHDELHARVCRCWVTLSSRNVLDAENRTCDDQDDEREERDSTQAVQWVPIPDDS